MKLIKPSPACPEDEAYLAYIDEHRNNVRQAFFKFGKPICLCLSLVNGEYDILQRHVNRHDVSKYNEEEFQGYRQWFFPKEGETKDKDMFQKAWKHHYETNQHHWEYFLNNGKPKEMPPLCIAEMLLDWIAMSMKFRNSPLKWYRENQDRITVHKDTRQKLEHILSVLAAYPVYPFRIRHSNQRKNHG